MANDAKIQPYLNFNDRAICWQCSSCGCTYVYRLLEARDCPNMERVETPPEWCPFCGAEHLDVWEFIQNPNLGKTTK